MPLTKQTKERMSTGELEETSVVTCTLSLVLVLALVLDWYWCWFWWFLPL